MHSSYSQIGRGRGGKIGSPSVALWRDCIYKWFNLKFISLPHIYAHVRHVFHARIYSTDLRSWIMHLDSNVSIPYLCVNKSYKMCKRRVYHKYYGTGVPSSLTVFECMKKVCSAWSFLNKKYTRENAVLRKSLMKLEPD